MDRPDRSPLRKTALALTAACLLTAMGLTACAFRGTYHAGNIPQPVLLGKRGTVAKPAGSPRPDIHPVAVQQAYSSEFFNSNPAWVKGQKIDAELLRSVSSPRDEIHVYQLQFRSMTFFALVPTYFFLFPVIGDEFRIDLAADVQGEGATFHAD